MLKACFVILHYVNLEDTINCIRSIKNNIKYDNYNIVVVDNASPNKSGKKLEELFKEDTNVKILLEKTNLGFSKGNNKGYGFAKDVLKSDLIVVSNSDVLFEQSDFIDLCFEIFKKERYHVLGPDIETPLREHQNPFRLKQLSKSDVKKSIIKKCIFLAYYKTKQFLRINDKINVLEKAFEKKSTRRRADIPYSRSKENVVLQGSCIILSALFIEKEEKVFCEDTFMYGEEDLLAYYCKTKQYKMLFDPSVRIFHLDGMATKKIKKTSLEKNIFFTQNALKGNRILLSKMRAEDYYE